MNLCSSRRLTSTMTTSTTTTSVTPPVYKHSAPSVPMSPPPLLIDDNSSTSGIVLDLNSVFPLQHHLQHPYGQGIFPKCGGVDFHDDDEAPPTSADCLKPTPLDSAASFVGDILLAPKKLKRQKDALHCSLCSGYLANGITLEQHMLEEHGGRNHR